MYEQPPSGVDWESIELELIEKVCRERQNVLQHVESMALLDGDHLEKNRVTWVRIKEATKLLELNKSDSTEIERRNDVLSHWLLKLGFCRTNELKSWFLKNEVGLFRLRISLLDSGLRRSLYQKYKLDFPLIPEAEIEAKRTMLQALPVCANQSIKTTWYRVPFYKVSQLGKAELDFKFLHYSVKLRHVYLENGHAFVPESSLNEFFVTEFRKSLSKSLAIASQRAAACLQGKLT